MISTFELGYSAGGRWLLDGIGITLQPGRLVVVIGPNGAGKSTLLRLLTGEIRPSRGKVLLGDLDIASIRPVELARLRAVVPQHTLLAFPFSVIEVVELGVTVPGLLPASGRVRRLALDMLERVDLSALANRHYPSLSGGERQRVHFARALAQLAASGGAASEQALLVDEPTSSLDIAHQLSVLEELKAQAARGRAVVAVLHDLNLAAAYADDILLLSEGRALAFGAPDRVLQNEILSAAYRCGVRINTVPELGRPFVLPQACQPSA
jgi:iron complex transport system ATP-binding protein